MHANVYSKWFLGLDTRPLVSAFLNRAAMHKPPMCKRAPTACAVLAATAYNLEQVLFFPDTLPVAGPQPSNVTWRDFDLTHCTTPQKPQHHVAAWPVVVTHLLYLWQLLCMKSYVSQSGLAVRLESRWASAQFCIGSPFPSKRLWFVDSVLWLRPSQLIKMALIAVHLNVGVILVMTV